MNKSDGVSIKTSLLSIMAYVLGYDIRKEYGKVPITCSTVGDQSNSLK